MKMRTIAKASTQGNNFDLLRLFAASSVIFSHSFGLIQNSGRPIGDPLYELTNGQITFGELGVFIFFICSGFLITASLQRSSGLRSYFIKRMLRIMPGLIFVVILSMLILGPLLSVFSLKDYFSISGTYTYLRNITMFFSQPDLPGVFSNNPVKGMVNGSLWTLKFEVFCYFFIALISKFRGLKILEIVLLAVACTIAGKFYHGFGSGYLFYLSFFLSGSALFLMRTHVPISGYIFSAMGLVLIVSAPLGILQAASALAGSYCILYIAYISSHGERFRRYVGDYSYGIYLFGFPVQQGVIALIGPSITWQQEFLIAYPITVALSLMSWKIVEEPAMQIRARLALRARDKLVLNGR